MDQRERSALNVLNDWYNYPNNVVMDSFETIRQALIQFTLPPNKYSNILSNTMVLESKGYKKIDVDELTDLLKKAIEHDPENALCICQEIPGIYAGQPWEQSYISKISELITHRDNTLCKRLYLKITASFLSDNWHTEPFDLFKEFSKKNYFIPRLFSLADISYLGDSIEQSLPKDLHSFYISILKVYDPTRTLNLKTLVRNDQEYLCPLKERLQNMNFSGSSIGKDYIRALLIERIDSTLSKQEET